MTNSLDNWNPDDELSESLLKALRDADDFSPDVPAEIDRAILRDAHEHFDVIPRIRRRRPVFRVIAAVSTVCAALLVFAILRSDRVPQEQIVRQSAPAEVMADTNEDSRDIDRNGIVNILDAYAMARRMQAGSPDKRWDFNRDGRLNDDDVRQVAMDAVAL